jgi:hypothetical protein
MSRPTVPAGFALTALPDTSPYWFQNLLDHADRNFGIYPQAGFSSLLLNCSGLLSDI